MSGPELKPCPFCGCKPDGYEGRQVVCRCGVMGPIGDEVTWNTRTDLIPDPHAVALAALEAAEQAYCEWANGAQEMTFGEYLRALLNDAALAEIVKGTPNDH